MEATAARQLTYLIVPFCYDQHYDLARRSLDVSKHWSRKSTDSVEHIFEHIKLLSSDSELHEEAIGQRYVLTAEGRKEAGWPRKTDARFLFQEMGDKEQFEFTIPEVQLFLFETQVGLVVYKVDYGDGWTVDQIIANNYRLKSFSRRYGMLTYKANTIQLMMEQLAHQGFDPHSVKLTMKYGMTAEGLIREWSELQPNLDFSMINWDALRACEQSTSVEWELAVISRKLTEQLAPASFFENIERQGSVYPSYALVFNASTVDASFRGWEEAADRPLKNYLFQMRRSFKSTYMPAEAEFHWSGNPEIYQAFENSWWGASLEGAANLTFLLGNRETGLLADTSDRDEKTNRFLLGNYYGNLESNYLYLYLLALHQRYALLYITRQASLLPKMMKVYLDETDGQYALQKLRDLQERMVMFTLRCSYKHVSNVTHQAKVYEMIRDTLKIELLQQELHFEMEAITSIMELRKQELQQKKDKEEAHRLMQEERRRERGERKNKLDEQYTKRFQTLIIFLTTLFVMVSTLNDGWGAIEGIGKQYGLQAPRLHSILNVFIIVTLVMIIVCFGYYAYSRIQNRRKQKQLDEEEA